MKEYTPQNGVFQLEVVTNFIQTRISFERIMTPITQRFGLTPLSSVTLNLIAHQESPTVSSIFKTLDLNQGNVSSMCKKLENDGFIQRCRCKTDERSVVLIITEKGHAALDGVERTLRAYFEDEQAVSKKDFMKALSGIEALKQIVQNVEKRVYNKDEDTKICLN